MDVIEEKLRKSSDEAEIEVRLSDIVLFFKSNFRKILIGGVIGLIVGAVYAFSQPNIFKVEVTIMPEVQGRGAGGFGSLSSFSGLGIDNVSTLDARPDLYPNVLQSVPFAMVILKQQVQSKELDTTMTLEEYINRTSSSSILDKIKSIFIINDDGSNTDKGKLVSKNIGQAIKVTKGQYNLIKAVQGSVSSTFDKKTGVITVVATEPDPVVAAMVANLSLKYLTDYIIAYRTDKARRRVNFLTKQVSDVKRRYENAEFALSNYRDRNVNVYLNTAKINEQRLQSNYLLEQSVYNDLARQLEQAKIKVEEDTPTFKILEPPIVPIYKSGPKRTYIILGFAIVSAIITCGILFIRNWKFI
ncbi:GumC domain-containing protein [Spirosoma endophyticum]|uniref:Chain length determinant protein n=1 Tax=Spirosoma endophyticum TaxID=662367 RepID=A0A1I1TK27_9BACT|nr:lipopolysaccharide biosynthesis protein [Spirosoma endophyticum]SFD55840.1 Chain length determinant protein [Spirosoma endophyticum]